MTLDELIRDMAARGEITHISLSPSPRGKIWRATFSPSSKMGVSFAEDSDPVKALQRAIAAPTGLKRRPSSKPTVEHDSVEDLM